jgi:CheY-like chemotaxis protein
MKPNQAIKILVIEDNEEDWSLMNKAFKQVLPKLSFSRAASSSEVFSLLQQWQDQEWDLPSLIFQDLYLPTSQQGFELLAQLKANESPCRHIPLMMMSISAQPTDIERAYQQGISSYMIMPTLFTGWLVYLEALRAYWLDTVTLPPLHFGFKNQMQTA